MKNQLIFIAIITFSLSVKAQIYTPGGTIQGTSSNNNVGIGTNSPTAKLETLNTTPGITSFKTRGVNGYLSVDNVGSGENYYSANNFHEFQIGGASKVRINSNGNVGIGTSNPTAKLHVNNGDNSYGTILANASESAFSLYAKSLSTQPVDAESFRLGLKYNNTEANGFISFYRGGSVDGGFLGFSTNGAERIRISNVGNVGIGTSNPIGLLDVQKSVSNAGGQSVVNITGSMWTGDGASVILNQVWNGNYYKTIIDNNGGNYAQTGSGLKIQTSYWDGSKVNSITSLVLSPTGNLGIGTVIPDEKLTVNGKIHAQEVRIDLSSPMTVPDYVFANDYKLKPLQEVENFIKQNSHLPEIPSAKEIEKNGLMLAEMNMSLLKKIEELTLYAIEQQKNTAKLIQLLDEQNKRLKILEESKN